MIGSGENPLHKVKILIPGSFLSLDCTYIGAGIDYIASYFVRNLVQFFNNLWDLVPKILISRFGKGCIYRLLLKKT